MIFLTERITHISSSGPHTEASSSCYSRDLSVFSDEADDKLLSLQVPALFSVDVAMRNVLLDTVSRCSRRCTNSRQYHDYCCYVYCTGGQCKIDQGNSELVVESERHLHLLQYEILIYFLFSTELVLRPHFTFASTPYILPLLCSYLSETLYNRNYTIERRGDTRGSWNNQSFILPNFRD